MTAIVALLLPVALAPTATARDHDPAAQRRQLQEQRAKKASEIDVLRASDDEVEGALDAVNTSVAGQEAAAAGARQAAVSATQAVLAARAAEQQARAQLERLRQEARNLAVHAYMHGGAAPTSDDAQVASVTDVVRAQAFVDAAVGRRRDLADELRAVSEDLADKRAAADRAQAAAAARQREVEARLSDLRGTQRRQQQLAASVEQRLERALGEAASLAAVDKQLADEIARRQAALARKVAPIAAPRSSGSSRPTAPGLRTVRGITVAAEIADELEALLNASDGAGLSLGGSGYRSSDGQVAMRRANCGTSDYDVYEKPASQCSPPTARPGESMHERGLAVDFTNNGRLIQSQSDPAFQWLRGNASRFGFYNLPAEPWHWSTNGN